MTYAVPFVELSVALPLESAISVPPTVIAGRAPVVVALTFTTAPIVCTYAA